MQMLSQIYHTQAKREKNKRVEIWSVIMQSICSESRQISEPVVFFVPRTTQEGAICLDMSSAIK